MKLHFSKGFSRNKFLRFLICLLLFNSNAQLSFSQNTNKNSFIKDSTNRFEIKGQILISNVGFAPIPAFSFDSPIMTGTLSIETKKLRYQPDFSIGLNGNPWMVNHWFRYTAIENKKFKLHVGVNPSLFFKNEYLNSDEEIVHAHRNITIELAGTRKISKKVSLILTYMHIKAFDQGTLSGDFIDFSCPVILSGRIQSIEILLQPQVFYFDFEGNIDGIYASNTISLTRQFPYHKISVSAYFQGVLPVKTDFSGNTFKWNAGFRYAF